ncbi:3-hydroxyisobutyrate dehydrogenase [Azospirillum agricola]|uniref:3-hydroxyisobutyrate dehydrogenase n=1 Tax=Azospirillum agricola TaxID=1720247 RepID=UPI000A0F08D4|nr:3-hydroxyisobutyrate dehydrogenase [Azospirillum agricola]SMH61925.1 3-hydroxyisobutyrate dehydrogenase [Azospirillum lipoferum]
MARIAFIGLGNMGRPMCENLVKAGNDVVGYDIAPAMRDAYAAAGGRVAATLAEALAEADTVISMIPTGKHVRAAYEGEGGILALARSGTLMIDCSTIDVDSAQAVSKAASAAGFVMVDAPVSGAVPAAQAGALTFMVGGTAEGYERAKPILTGMGKNLFHVGASGSGNAMKICNNMMAGMSMVAISEVFTLAEKLGLDNQAVYDVVTRSSGNCWALQAYCPVPGPVPTSPANRDYQPGFTAAMMLKDMRLSQQAASASGAATPLAGSSAAFYQMLVESGHGAKDFSAVFELISGRLGRSPAEG